MAISLTLLSASPAVSAPQLPPVPAGLSHYERDGERVCMKRDLVLYVHDTLDACNKLPARCQARLDALSNYCTKDSLAAANLARLETLPSVNPWVVGALGVGGGVVVSSIVTFFLMR